MDRPLDDWHHIRYNDQQQDHRYHDNAQVADLGGSRPLVLGRDLRAFVGRRVGHVHTKLFGHLWRWWRHVIENRKVNNNNNDNKEADVDDGEGDNDDNDDNKIIIKIIEKKILWL